MPGIEIDKIKVLYRIHTLRMIYDSLEEKYFDGQTYLNLNTLKNCVDSYFYDIERTKHFHKIKYADQHKKAAYTIKWITKLRPIHMVKDSKVCKRVHLLANEIFAVVAGFNFLNANLTDISQKYYNNLLYIFRYRNFDGLCLSSQMYLLECAINKNSP